MKLTNEKYEHCDGKYWRRGLNPYGNEVILLCTREQYQQAVVNADYNEIVNESPGLLTYHAVEHPHAYAAMMAVVQPQEPPQKRTVAISRDGVTTVFDAQWLKALRDDYDDTIADFEAGTGRV